MIKKCRNLKIETTPEQGIYLTEPESKIEKLAEDIKKNGQRVPIEITPDYVIIDGHCRLEAIKKLGQKTILAVTVEVEDEIQLRQRHLDANINRRHLERIDQVRLIKAQLDLDSEQKTYCRDELRLRIAKAFGQDKSDPTVRRYYRLVHLPDLIQEKFKRKELRLMTALKFDTLNMEEREELLKLIELEEMSPAKAFEQFFPPKQTAPAIESIVPAVSEVEDGGDCEIRPSTPEKELQEIAESIREDVTQIQDEVFEKLSTRQGVSGLIKASLKQSKDKLEDVIERLDEHHEAYRKFRNGGKPFKSI